MKNEKKQEKVWWLRKNSVPLHPQFSKSAESSTENDAPVAQLVEHLTLNQGVQSSSLCGCTRREVFSLSFFCFSLSHQFEIDYAQGTEQSRR